MKGANAISSTETNRNTDSLSLDKIILNALEDAKALDIVTIDIQGKSSMGDFIMVASGTSQRHVSSVADQVIDAIKATGNAGTLHTEGLQGSDWVLIDAGDIIVHLFRPEVREFYALEKMWQAPDLGDKKVH